MESLKDRVAIVTGASRGIGLGIAAELVRQGARVCITARNPEPLAEAVAELGGPDVAIAVPGKADDPGHQAEAVERTIEAFGRLDMLVNNTGINPVYGPVIDIDPMAAAKILAVNVLAPLAWTRRARDAWMGEHGGSVVNVASVAGLLRGSQGIGMYGVSKAALIRLTVELAVELGPRIRVNAVAPAVVKTKFATALYEGREEQVSAAYPLKRLGVPEDVAGAVAFLLSDQASDGRHHGGGHHHPRPRRVRAGTIPHHAARPDERHHHPRRGYRERGGLVIAGRLNEHYGHTAGLALLGLGPLLMAVLILDSYRETAHRAGGAQPRRWCVERGRGRPAHRGALTPRTAAGQRAAIHSRTAAEITGSLPLRSWRPPSIHTWVTGPGIAAVAPPARPASRTGPWCRTRTGTAR